MENKQTKQQEIFNNFSNGDELVSYSNSKWKVKQNNKDNVYFLVFKKPTNEWKNKLIFEIDNDNRARFIMKWKTNDILLQTLDNKWHRAKVVVLNKTNQWDNEIIESWTELAKGLEHVRMFKENEPIFISKW